MTLILPPWLWDPQKAWLAMEGQAKQPSLHCHWELCRSWPVNKRTSQAASCIPHFFFFFKVEALITFPLRTAFAQSHRFEYIVLSFSFVSRKLLMYILISSSTRKSFTSMYLYIFTCSGVNYFKFYFIMVSKNDFYFLKIF